MSGIREGGDTRQYDRYNHGKDSFEALRKANGKFYWSEVETARNVHRVYILLLCLQIRSKVIRRNGKRRRKKMSGSLTKCCRKTSERKNRV